jgi:tRNA dimethylallyltransferase
MNALLYAQSFGNASACDSVRKKYEEILRDKGREYLHGLLKEVDPESAEILHQNDTVRVIRALEIYELTGRKKSEQRDEKIPRYPFVSFAFDYPREELYARIERRVDRMIGAGLVEEVKMLLQSGVPENAQCMQGIGYKEVVESLKNGELQSTMSDAIKKNTRNYAKRQLTFFKKTENLHWLKPTDIQEAAEEIVKIYES